MSKLNLIFLMGYKNVGKDTVANIINKLSGNKYEIISFADALKQDYYHSIGKVYNKENEEREFKEGIRNDLIEYGESMKRQKGEHYWIEQALDASMFFEHQDKGIIVPDCRRVEEVYWFKDYLEGRLIKYMAVRNKFQPHFFAVHRQDAEVHDKDYLTKNAIRVATDNFLVNRLIKNYGDLKKLEKTVEEIYACRLK